MKYILLLSIVLFSCHGTHQKGEEDYFKEDTAILEHSKIPDSSSAYLIIGQTIVSDSPIIIMPALGKRTCFIYDGEEWFTFENTVGIKSIQPFLVSIFEFVDAGDTSLKSYSISRVTCTHKQLRELQVKLWDCKRFASNGAEWEDNEDSIARFPIYIKGERMNCGNGDFTGTLSDLMKEIEVFF